MRRLAPLACVVLLACTSATDDSAMPPVVLGMTGDMAPVYDDGEEKLYQVQTQVRLPFRRPEDGERPSGDAPPYPRAPFHVATDSRITVRFTLTNLDDAQHTVELLVDPWNEYVRYVPGFVEDRDRTIPNLSGIDRFFVVPAKSRIEGIVTPDDMLELAIDLTTAMRIQKSPPPAGSQFEGAALYNRAFNVQNRSTEPDPVLAPYLPLGPVATVIGFDLGLRTRETAKIAVEIVVDIDDLAGDRVITDGTTDKLIGRPGGTLSPPAQRIQ